MKVHVQLFVIVLLGGFAAQRAAALEVNYWPFFTGERDEERRLESLQVAGPLVFWKSDQDPPAPPRRIGGYRTIEGVRPLFVHFEEFEDGRGSFHFLYPLFNLRYRPYGVSWDVFSLLRFQSFTPESAETTRSLHLFPIVFWQDDPDPENSYFGIFPIAGRTRNTFSYDEIKWLLFPLHARLTRGEVVTHAMPWPFIRVVRGPETRGFHLWPLYGQVARENHSSHRYWLWPLGYSVRRELWKEEPYQAFGFLPFYTSSTSERAVSRTFIWPFFGYTESSRPEYHERRYFWPLLVQRRGESYINRWMPFYSRSVRGGEDKRWILWPLHRSSTWEERGLRNDRTQFLYFLYWSNVQSSVANPDLAPAVKQHLWPFYSYWNNGAGRRQFQALSPFEVFFPFNEVVRAKYSPLFAFYRMESEEGVRSRHSWLFNFITTRREVEDEEFYLHVGPLVSYGSGPERREVTILKGLFSYSRDGEERSFGAFWLNRQGDPSRREQPGQRNVRRPEGEAHE